MSPGEARWAIATLRDLTRTSADPLDRRFPFERELVRNPLPALIELVSLRLLLNFKARVDSG